MPFYMNFQNCLSGSDGQFFYGGMVTMLQKAVILDEKSMNRAIARISCEIIERNMSCLAEYLNAASYLFCGHEFEAVLAGGILINNPSCVETLKRVCRSEAIPVSFRLAEKDPVFGALAIAVRE